MLTRQEFFDRSTRALAEQGRPAYGLQNPDVSTSGMCFYRAPDGGKCAVGHLIPDLAYHEGLEGEVPMFLEGEDGTGVTAALGNNAAEDPDDLGSPDVYFMRAVQSAHDDAALKAPRPEYWRPLWVHNLREVAHTYGLDKSAIPEG